MVVKDKRGRVPGRWGSRGPACGDLGILGIFEGMIDLHCHLLPGLDDGAVSMESSVEMARQLVEAGVSTVAPSPHYGEGPGGDVPVQEATRVRELLQERLRKEGVELTLLPNAEHHISPALFERVDRGAVVPLGGGGRWLLVELPWSPVPNAEDILFRLQMKGYRVLLAHPERHGYLAFEGVERLVERGVKLQIELGSWVGVYGRRARKRARRFGDRGLAHVVASDLHRPEAWIDAGMRAVLKRYGEGGLARAMQINPRALLDDAAPEVVRPFSEAR